MKGTRKRLAVATVATLSLVVAAALVVTAGPATADQFATLRVLEGRVDVRLGEEATFHQADDNVSLSPGDVVRTGPDGRAAIDYFDGSVTRLDVNTAFALEELAGVEGGGKVIDAQQLGGQTFNRVTELTGSQSRFEIATPTATASVRGTVFVTKHLINDTSLVWVLDGGVNVSTGDDPDGVLVHRMHGVTVHPDGTTSPVYVLTAAQLNDPWLSYNLCDLEGQLTVCSPPQPAPAPAPTDTEEPAASGTSDDVVLGTSVSTTQAAAAPTGNGGGKKGGNDGGGNPPPPPPDDEGPPDEEDPDEPEPTLIEQVCIAVEDATGLDVPSPC